jgi:integrase
MMDVNITRRKRRRVQRDGSVKYQVRYVVSYHLDDQRIQRFFEARGEAVEFRTALTKGRIPAKREPTTLGELMDRWLENKRGSVRPATYTAYFYYTKKLEPLRATQIGKLTTRAIREWYNNAIRQGEAYSVSRALAMLQSALALHAENTGTHQVAAPNGLQRRQQRRAKKHLSLQQIKEIVANGDPYIATLFLTGMRISEMLGLQWSDIDFDANIIRVCRIQEKTTGRMIEATKTSASNRVIPLSNTLRQLLLKWKTQCPSHERVFPAKLGGPLLYSNFLHRMWKPALHRMGLPYVPIHSARHSFISLLQASGTEIAVAALLAGHSSPLITARHYTHAVRGGEEAVVRLDAVTTSVTTLPVK